MSDLRVAPAPDLTHLPGADGRPLVGHTIEYLRDPYGFAFRMHARHGPLFRSRVFFERGVAVAGPDFAERFFVDRDELFSSRQGWWNVLGAFFPGGLMLRDFAEHRLHRRIMQVAFKKQALEGYVGLIDPMMARALDDVGDGAVVKVYPFIKRLLLDTAANVFVGVELREESDRLNRDFVAVMHAAGAGVRKPIPLTPYWRGLRARKRLKAWFERLLAARSDADRRADMLTVLRNAVSEEGERFAADDIVEHVLFLLMAAHDTTTSGLTCLLMLLAMHPEWQERARADVMALPDKDRLEHDDLQGMPVLWDCFREALRLYPPVRSIPRRTTRACEVEGHAIPANTPMWVNVELNHRDPAIWTRPDAFEPDRFAEPREEHKRHKFAWLPFGGGAHTCLGLQFSRLEMAAFMVRLLRRFRVSLPAGYSPRMRYLPFVKPIDDLPLRFERLPAG
ncbi:MAG: cytochrome P450 [Deltaproteobacteria bacterium]|nr:cytochrome P450 [Deltaproteobacteria bacterium]